MSSPLRLAGLSAAVGGLLMLGWTAIKASFDLAEGDGIAWYSGEIAAIIGLLLFAVTGYALARAEIVGTGRLRVVGRWALWLWSLA